MNVRVWHAVLLAGLAVGVVGCENGGGGSGGVGLFGRPAISEDDDAYTIRLQAFTGPDRFSQAGYYKKQTEALTRWKGLYIVHSEDRSELFWGRYRSVAAAGSNLKKAKAMQTKASRRPYAGAMVVLIPGKDVGNPQWVLSNASGEYTVLVAVFYDMPERNYVGRKRFAAQYCKSLRENSYEGYFYHYPARSIVTIGSFGANTVAKVRQGKQTHMVVRDPAVKQIMSEFPDLAVNGGQERVKVFNAKTGRFDWVLQKSHVMPIPRKKGAHVPTSVDRSGYRQPGQAP